MKKVFCKIKKLLQIDLDYGNVFKDYAHKGDFAPCDGGQKPAGLALRHEPCGGNN